MIDLIIFFASVSRGIFLARGSRFRSLISPGEGHRNVEFPSVAPRPGGNGWEGCCPAHGFQRGLIKDGRTGALRYADPCHPTTGRYGKADMGNSTQALPSGLGRVANSAGQLSSDLAGIVRHRGIADFPRGAPAFSRGGSRRGSLCAVGLALFLRFRLSAALTCLFPDDLLFLRRLLLRLNLLDFGLQDFLRVRSLLRNDGLDGAMLAITSDSSTWLAGISSPGRMTSASVGVISDGSWETGSVGTGSTASTTFPSVRFRSASVPRASLPPAPPLRMGPPPGRYLRKIAEQRHFHGGAAGDERQLLFLFGRKQHRPAGMRQ